MQTTKLRNGTTVLAKADGTPMHFLIRDQAVAAAKKLGARVYAPAMLRMVYLQPVMH